MKRSLVLLSSVIAIIGATTACSVERTSSVLGPTAAGKTAAVAGPTATSSSLLGTWVVAGTATKSSVTTSAETTLPDFSSCDNFQWAITTQTATEASGKVSADCAGGLALAGNITGTLGAPTIPLVIDGMLTHDADRCPFSLTGVATPLSSVTFRITYSGSTCLGPLQGESLLNLAPHSAPTTPTASSFTLNGTLTDGTSGGILPAIEVSIPGYAVRTDSAGRYQLPFVPAGANTVQFAAAGYDTQTKTVTLNANTVLDTVLQRVAPPASAPGSGRSGGGDQIDMHSVIVRGGCCTDVANWPVTTNLRVLDIQSSGAFVDFDAKSRWPEVIPPGWDGGIQYTLWMVVNHNGQWITAGGVEYWRGLQRQGGPPSRYASNWYYSPQVWGELASHQPYPGEQVGFFVTAGDQRAKDLRAVTERSNVVLVPFPSDGGGYFPF